MILVMDERFEEHLTGRFHPESPLRTQAIKKTLEKAAFFNPSMVKAPRKATLQELQAVHPLSYIELVEEASSFCSHNTLLDGSYTLPTGDVKISPASYETARLAAGGVLIAVDEIFQGSSKTAFCAVRPPGHHACTSMGMGFCLFNNVAVGVRYAQKKYGLEKVLIVDWDVHHGNGTQEIFFFDPSVFYFSTHQWPLYPGTGAKEEVGVGNILNCPIPAGPFSREAIFNAFNEELIPRLKDFQPELIFISAGFDAHRNDPLGGMNLESEDFATLTHLIKDMAKKYTGGKIISVLEGGYDIPSLTESVVAHVKALI